MSLQIFLKVILVTGARQVGKTTFPENTLSDARFVTFDTIQNRTAARSSPDAFIDALSTPCILDEVQFVPELFSSIKRVVDQSELRGQFFLTGSHNFSVLPKE